MENLASGYEGSLKIAILAPYLPPIYSGAGKQTLRIGRELIRNGHAVTFVTARFPGMVRSSDVRGLPLCEVSMKRVPTSMLGQMLFGVMALKIFVKKRKDFDILFCPGMGTLIGFLFAALKLMRKKIVLRLSVFTDDPKSLRKRKLGFYFLFPYRLADAIIAPSTARLKAVIDFFPEKTHQVVRITNCVDTEKFKPCGNGAERQALKRKLNLDPEKKYVSYVGRIIARKGVEFLLEAWQKVCEAERETVLLLIGPSGYESKGMGNSTDPLLFELKKKMMANDLEGRVIFVGETDRVHEYLKVSDVFVFASRAEGLPSAPIEAMAAGVPPVVLNIKDVMPDIISSGEDGIIIGEHDISLFSKSLLKLLGNDDYRSDLGVTARRNAIERFSIKIVTKRYMDIFYSIMKSVK